MRHKMLCACPSARAIFCGVQMACMDGLSKTSPSGMGTIYEEDFLGFSYGFRPGRNQHNALDAVTVGISRRKVSWVFDADIRGFYDAVDRGWLVKFVEHRIGDERVVRHVKKWLNAGVLEDGKRMRTMDRTSQGGQRGSDTITCHLYPCYVTIDGVWPCLLFVHPTIKDAAFSCCRPQFSR